MECLQPLPHSRIMEHSPYLHTASQSNHNPSAESQPTSHCGQSSRSQITKPKSRASGKSSERLKWVTYTQEGDFRNQKTRKEIRSYVMKTYLAKQDEKSANGIRHGSDSYDRGLPPLYRSPMPAGAGFDPFKSLPQASDRRISVEKLKRNCIIFFHSAGLKGYWTARALKDRLFFLSSLSVTSQHADVMYDCRENPTTIALEGEVVKLLQDGVKTDVAHSSDVLLGCVLHVASAGHYNAPDNVVAGHYSYLKRMVQSRGGFKSTKIGRDLAQLILINALLFFITREMIPQQEYLEAAAAASHDAESYQMESPLHAPDPGFVTVAESRQCSDTLLELLQVMRQLTQLVDPRCRTNGYLTSYDDSKFNLRAQLLTFQPPHTLQQNGLNEAICKSCRIASIIFERAVYHSYSLSQAAQNTSLISQLKETLVKTNLEDCWNELAGLLLWVVLIGAAAARDRPERPWLVAVAMKVSITRAFNYGDAMLAAMVRLANIQGTLKENGDDAIALPTSSFKALDRPTEA